MKHTRLSNRSMTSVSNRYCKGIHSTNLSRVSSVALRSETFCASRRISRHRVNMSVSSDDNCPFRVFVLDWVICSAENAKTSSESNLRMSILFSHSERFARDELTSSGINPGQFCGHSCFNIYCCVGEISAEIMDFSHLNEHQIEFVDVNLFLSEVGLLRRHIHCASDHKIAHTLALLRWEGHPSCSNELLQYLQTDVLQEC
jgi:hypothetical protein